jgi:hypothetical protein
MEEEKEREREKVVQERERVKEYKWRKRRIGREKVGQEGPVSVLYTQSV